MTAAVTLMSVTLSRHPIAVRRQSARLVGSLVVAVLGPQRLLRGAQIGPVAVTPPGVVLVMLKLAVHAVLHPIHAVLRRRPVVKALILEVLPTVPVAPASLLKVKGALRGVPSEVEENAGRRSASIGMHPLGGRAPDLREARGFLVLDLSVGRLEIVSVRVLIVPVPLVANVLMWPGQNGRRAPDRSEPLTHGVALALAIPREDQARMPHVVTRPRTVDRRALPSVRSGVGVPTIRVHNVPRGRIPVMHPPGEMRAQASAPVQSAVVPVALPAAVLRIRARREMGTGPAPRPVRLMPVRHAMGSVALQAGALPVEASPAAVPLMSGRRARAIGPIARNN
jgi:hypothetical protein